ncbi:transcription termination factor MTEF18, mitochondrial-like isoform X2 [Mangifera indica]|uniref:transcription termination factor MTEF18, mitochondrial-like isoform X2 n=1 Tax=Mangifera indica TaxID=29780 RepID=UPI001CF970CA|nr:transcription termination factor MTEF18, mitochondrial-like isoform X2 [Mangifera indica]
MTHFQKLRNISNFKWGSSIFSGTPTGSFYIAQTARLYRTKKIVKIENGGSVNEDLRKLPVSTIREAQAALLEYLHSTRNLQFLDAEIMSKNSPYFLQKILKRVENEADIQRSITRFLRYHPINEFEPFFESLGFTPSEYSPFLPRDLMFLSDDELLLENYHVLRSYGIAQNNIGKIYKAAIEVFRNNYGVLSSKLQAYERLGLSKSVIRKFIVLVPCLLNGDVNEEFVKVLETLKSVGIELSWVEKHLLEKNSCNWRMMLSFLRLLREIGCSEEQLGRIIQEHPELLLEGSVDRALTLIGSLLKFGSTKNEICLMFQQLPRIQVGKFYLNLRQCIVFLNEIEMQAKEIMNFVRTHPVLLGSCSLKKTNSLLSVLNVGKARLCKYILDNPQDIKNWVIGSKVEPLSNSGEKERSQKLKIEFLLSIGFVKNSKEMEKVQKLIRAKGWELQERFDNLAEAGIDRKDVFEMKKFTKPSRLMRIEADCPQFLFIYSSFFFAFELL